MYDTGLALPAKDVLLQLVSSCAQRNVTVLVDEAFIDYTPLHSLTAGPLPEDATLVIYMPGRDFDRIARELAAAGAKADTPCCAVSHAATARQTHAA
jgi:siroheme synthase